MPNNYFQFKQFTIQQDKCAMKVCTDACLFGAWVAQEIQHHNCVNILDIGTGTGLLSLMLAQKTVAHIDAVEINKEAYEQAAVNVQQSPFSKSIKLHHSNIANFYSGYKYGCIICNPPFFEADLKSTHQNKNDAKHDTALTLAALCARATQLLKDDGYFAVLLPHHRTDYFVTESLQHGFYCSKIICVKQTPNHNYFRSMMLLSLKKKEAEEKEVIIKDTHENYSPAFTQLLKDYYLYL